jgi:tetratricopeptide (TPR) repeat protein
MFSTQSSTEILKEYKSNSQYTSEPIRVFLIGQVHNNNLDAMIDLIDHSELDLDIIVPVVAEAFIILGVVTVLEKIFQKKTDRDWYLLNLTIDFLERNLYFNLLAEVVMHSTKTPDYNSKAFRLFSSNACRFIDDNNYRLSLADNLLERLGFVGKGPQDADEFDIISNISIAYQKSGMIEKYRKCCLYCLEYEKRVYGADHDYVVNSYEHLGISYFHEGNIEMAMLNYNMSRQILSSKYPKSKYLLHTVFHNIALAHQNMGEYHDAIDLYNKTLEASYAINGQISPGADITLINLGEIYMEINDYSNAEKAFLESLAIRELLYGRESELYLESLFKMSILNYENRKYEDAVDSLTKVVQILKGLDAEQSIICDRLGWLSASLIECKEYAKSLQILSEELKIYSELDLNDSKWLGKILFRFGESHEGLEEYEKAINYYNKAYDQFNGTGILFKLAKCYNLIGDLQNALAYYVRYAEEAIKRKGSITEKVSGAINNILVLAKELDRKDILLKWHNYKK